MKKLLLSMVLLSAYKYAHTETCTASNKQAKCHKLELVYFPKDLGKDLKVLDLSFNRIEILTKWNMALYPDLSTFIFNNYRPETEIHPDAFISLSKLRYLSLIKAFTLKTRMSFPPNLEELYLQGVEANANLLELTTLKHLRVLDLENNQFYSFPILDLGTPLYHLYLTENPMNSFKTENLAPFCLLREFKFNIENIQGIIQDTCECRRLKEWVQMRRIHGIQPTNYQCPSVKCTTTPLIPEKMKNEHKKCATLFNLDDEDEENVAKKSSRKRLLLLLLFGAIIFFIILGIYLYSKKSESEPKKPEDEEQKNLEEEPIEETEEGNTNINE